ncbi:VWA domain-containing protein [Streptomyces sp. NPDC000151]|uniref:vWA domain-containing protein n=1 Tax=Streptomyces sp. NPDC000151 TaxID=3154244 RepID=UPI00332B9046
MGIRSLLRNAFGRSKAASKEPDAVAATEATDEAAIPEAREESAPSADAVTEAAPTAETEVPAARTEQAPARPEPAYAETAPAAGAAVLAASAASSDAADISDLVREAFDRPSAVKPEVTEQRSAEPTPAEAAPAEAAPAEEPPAEAKAAATTEVEAEVEVEEPKAATSAEVEAKDEVEVEPEIKTEPEAAEPVAAEPVAAEPEPVTADAEQVTAEAPADQPKAEEPKTEAPAEEPKAAEPQADEPKAEAQPEAEPEVVAEPEPEPTPAATIPAARTESPAEATTEAPAEPVPAPAEAAAPAAADAAAPADGEARPALSLAKVEDVAPGLVSLYKDAGAALEKQGLTAQRAAVYLALDRSGSMRNYYKDGTVQHLAEQALGLSAHLDDDGTVPVVFFSTDIDGTADLDLTGYEGRIEELHAGLGHMGRTNYHWAIKAVVDHYKKSKTTAPAFVIFQTDGAPTSKPAAEKALCEAAGLPIFWQFVGFGDPEAKGFDFLRKLDDLAVPEKRKVDNAGFFHAGRDPRALADADLYAQLMIEFPEWLTEARAAGVLKDRKNRKNGKNSKTG